MSLVEDPDGEPIRISMSNEDFNAFLNNLADQRREIERLRDLLLSCCELIDDTDAQHTVDWLDESEGGCGLGARVKAALAGHSSGAP